MSQTSTNITPKYYQETCYNYVKNSGFWVSDCSPLLHYHYVSTLLTMQIPTETLSQSHQLCFIGKERDSETGFSYFGARYYDSDILTAWLSVDPMADKYPSLSPYAYCAWNPVKLVDPDGEDWYQSDDGTAICWRKGNDIEFQKEGQKFLNIGSNYAYSVGNMTIHYNQNNAEYIYFSTSTNFISQSRGDNCM